MTDRSGTPATAASGFGAGGPTGPGRAANAARTAVVWDALSRLLDRLFDGEPLEIVDAGGGTGGAAVPLAELGHRVTVVEPSPDSLAALERRAAESGVMVRGVQGETQDLASLFPAASADLVLVHNVLEYVDDPVSALADVAGVTRPGGAVSLLVTNAVAGALHRVLAGHITEARHMLEDPDGRWGGADPVPRRFTRQQLLDLIGQSGLTGESVRGVRVFADILPGHAWEGDAQAGQQLVELERAVADHPELIGVATQLHAVALKP
ncbi:MULTISPECIES: methyltransferase domain-containing protein [unclassified Nocardiopsis]|uniref:methyltransferase domain-containing protein n=1 Tax=unclassified Nocardiopsis TaxID=2649073 RepID=UPI00066AE9ED|nr:MULTISPECIES: methyltransferase domain-containing protein [unclassified Nocardiopsis]MBQ1083603.1 methyltransferase domain-containing protein [Nocardiopsis sp. B62]